MACHRFPEDFQCCFAITALCDKAFQDFPFMINSSPKIVRLTVDLHDHLVQLPLPVCPQPHSTNPFLTDLSCKQRAKSIPPKSNRFVADIDAAFVQKIFNIAKRKRKPNIHHDGQTDDLGARLELAKGAGFCHPVTRNARPARLNRFSSDRAQRSVFFDVEARRTAAKSPSRQNIRTAASVKTGSFQT